ncbi:MAG: glycoside hydrolase family 99-like domain-containing protein [Chloroflexi bacterium]|nr:glycoside hydrolase family 99-like domain-containing protein [Chloroflexota bacterium]
MTTRLLLLVLAVVLALACVGPPAAGRAADRHLVMALYYPWFDESTWGSGQTADVPLIPYDSFDPEAIRQHVAWAKEARIDALMSAWYGPADDNPTERNFTLLLDEAQRQGLSAGLLLETDSSIFFPDRASLVRALRRFLAVHAAHPAYLHLDGRPAILVWRPSAVYGTNGTRVYGSGAPVAAAWRALLDEVDPNRTAVWIAEGEDVSVLDVFDGIFPYSIAWAGDPAAQLSSYARRVAAYNVSHGTAKLWIATAMPGYDDTHIAGRGRTFAVDRAGGAYYRRTFEGAIASGADHITITSFNEWLEGHQIEPSTSYGTLYLDLTRELVGEFKGN